jgi:photosystem II stability/assembly factor-like uncharacterized protein
MKFKHFLFSLIYLACFSYASTIKAQWETSFSGPGSSINWPYVFYVSVVDTNVVWASLANLEELYSANEIIRTSNGGQNWVRKNTPAASFNSYNINLFAQDSLTAWVTRVSLPNEDSTTIYKTIDGGDNWLEVSLPFSNNVATVIAIHFFNLIDGFAYAETHDGSSWYIECYYTNDGGSNWEVATTPNMVGERVFIWHGNNNYAVQGDTIWFGTSLSRVFRSIDKGVNWEAFSVPFYHIRMAESVAFLDSKNGIVATALSDSFLVGGLAFNDAVRTDDGGETWTRIPIPHENIMIDPRMMGLCAVPGSNGVYMLNGYRQTDLVYQQMISEDNGLTWYYVEGAESKVRCMQFISPTQGWGGGWNYFGNGLIEKIFKWSGPPLIGIGTTKTNEWNKLQASIKLWPNPTVDNAFLQIANSENEEYTIEIFDLSGKLVLYTKQKSNISNSLDLKNWEAGAYIVKITGENTGTARALIKQ